MAGGEAVGVRDAAYYYLILEGWAALGSSNSASYVDARCEAG